MKSRLVKLIFLLAVICLTSCTARYLPVPEGDVRVNEELAYIKNSDYFFSVERRNWYRSPDEINSYFTCFYITVKNRNQDDMKVQLKDLFLIDEEGNSQQAVNPERLQDYFLPFNDRMGSFNEEQDSWQQQQERALLIRDNIFSYSFQFGILPGQTQREGYIFFPKVSKKNKKYSLKFKAELIEFRKMEGRNKE